MIEHLLAVGILISNEPQIVLTSPMLPTYESVSKNLQCDSYRASIGYTQKDDKIFGYGVIFGSNLPPESVDFSLVSKRFRSIGGASLICNSKGAEILITGVSSDGAITSDLIRISYPSSFADITE